MTSGIYKLTFSNGDYYIGRSYNIENRYAQHLEDMKDGTAAKSMQAAFRVHGAPSLEVIHAAHVDYLYWLEDYYIWKYNGPRMLNTSKASVDYDPSNYGEIVGVSIKDTLELLVQYKKQGLQQLELLEEIIASRTQEEIEADVDGWIEYYKNKHEESLAEVERLKSRNLWQRIWNL